MVDDGRIAELVAEFEFEAVRRRLVELLESREAEHDRLRAAIMAASLSGVVRDPHYRPAAVAEVLRRQAACGVSVSTAFRWVLSDLRSGAWMPPLDVGYERERLADLGRRIAALSARWPR